MGATPASAWKGKVQVQGQELELPSGNVCLAKQITPDAFLSSDLIPDPLTGMIRTAIKSKQGLPPSAMKKVAEDKETMSAALQLFDRVLAHVMVEPHVEMPPTCDVEDAEGEVCGEYANTEVHKPQDPKKLHDPKKHKYHEGPRNPDVLYTDQVEMQDKMHIFNWALGGVKKYESFRGQFESSLGSLSDSEDLQDTPV